MRTQFWKRQLLGQYNVRSEFCSDLVRSVPVDPRSGERRITDTLLRLVGAYESPLVYVTNGQYFDIGDRRGLLAANNFAASIGLS